MATERPDEDEACPNMPTRYCDWACVDSCFRFPWQPGKDADDGD